METAFSLGSNLGDRISALGRARDEINSLPGMRLVAESPLYETEPVDVAEENKDKYFINAVVIFDSSIAPAKLVEHTRNIETRLGRVRVAQDRNAPRTIDIDMIYCGNLTCNEKGLQLPHPSYRSRRFVCRPLADLRPDLVLPGDVRGLREILAGLPPTPGVRRLDTPWPATGLNKEKAWP